MKLARAWCNQESLNQKETGMNFCSMFSILTSNELDLFAQFILTL